MSSTPRRSQQFLENIDKVGRYRWSVYRYGRCARTSLVWRFAPRSFGTVCLAPWRRCTNERCFWKSEVKTLMSHVSHFCQIFGVLKVKNFACQSSHMSPDYFVSILWSPMHLPSSLAQSVQFSLYFSFQSRDCNYCTCWQRGLW